MSLRRALTSTASPPAPPTGIHASVLGIAVVTFHHKHGNLVEFIHPEYHDLNNSVESKSNSNSQLKFEDKSVLSVQQKYGVALPAKWANLAYLAIPEGSHVSSDDSCFFSLPDLQDSHRSVYGVAVTKQISTANLKNLPKDMDRNTLVKSVCVILNEPVFGIAKEKLNAVVQCFFLQEAFENYDIIIEMYDSLNFNFKAPITTDSYLYGLSLQPFVTTFKKECLTIFKLLMLGQKLVIFAPNGSASTTVVSIASLFPSCFTYEVDDVKTKANRSIYGLPLRLWNNGQNFFPHLPVTQLEKLKLNSYFAGVTSPMFEKHPFMATTNFANLQTGELVIKDKELQKALACTPADLKFMETLIQNVELNISQGENSVTFEGSDSYIRKNFEAYIVSFLSNAQNYPDIFSETKHHDSKGAMKEFGSKFFEHWTHSTTFKTWKDGIGENAAPAALTHPGALMINVQAEQKKKDKKEKKSKKEEKEHHGHGLLRQSSNVAKQGLGFFSSIGRKKGKDDKVKRLKSCCQDFGVFFEQNEDWRDKMEDEHELIDKFGDEEGVGFFAVYDGHAGRKAVEFVKQNLSSAILQHKSEGWEKAMTRAYSEIDEKLLPLCAAEKDRSGCTSTTIVLAPPSSLTNTSSPPSSPSSKLATLFVANVGDSAAYLVSQTETAATGYVATRITANHNSRTNQEEVARIKNSGGVVFGKKVGGQLSVTRAFGNSHLKTCGVIVTPETARIELSESHSHLIVACDGLWDVCTGEKLCELIQQHKNETPTQFATTLVQFALQSKSKDNISVIVITL